MVNLTRGLSRKCLVCRGCSIVLARRTVRFNLGWDASYLFLAVWMRESVKTESVFHLSNHEEFCTTGYVVCDSFSGFFFVGGKRGGWACGRGKKQGKCSNVLRDLPFIDSIFWAFKVYRKVSETAKMWISTHIYNFSHHSSAWEMS